MRNLFKKIFLSLISLSLVLGLPHVIYAQEGSLDTSFGGGTGYVFTNFCNNVCNENAWSVGVQPDGKIVAGGYTTTTENNVDLAIARYNNDGSLDTSFGNGGKVTFDYGEYDFMFDGIAVQQDSKIVIAAANFGSVIGGQTQNTTAYLLRYNPDGNFDNTFGQSGKAFLTGNYYFDAVAIQSDGKIIATGAEIIAFGNLRFLAARFNVDGSLDTSFGNGGIVLDDFGTTYASGEKIVIQTDGKIVFNIQFSDGSGLARLNNNGSIDLSFGSNGLVHVATTYPFSTYPFYGLGIQTDGKILLGGTYGDFTLIRYNPDGSVDTGFGQGGIVTTEFFGLEEDAFKLVIQKDGKIVLVGSVYTVGPPAPRKDIGVARFNLDGSLDTSFGTNGKTTADFGGTFEWAYNVALQPDGQIVVAVAGGNEDKFVVARFNGTPVNEAPIITSITAPMSPIQVNTSFQATANFIDANTNDTHTAIWDWGDGTITNGAVTEDNGSGTVTGTHSYTSSSVYTLKLTLNDQVGGSDEEIFQYVVVYDPTGGFVTGAGIIDSPQGALTSNPTLIGKANFGFVSKYQNGANVPTGQTMFKFHLGNLDFKSTNYQWLVVAGAKAQYKGEGEIGGQGNYGFIVTAKDGDINGSQDEFRIKIWDKNNNNTIIYDNKLGESDNLDQTQIISSGNIVIQN